MNFWQKRLGVVILISSFMLSIVIFAYAVTIITDKRLQNIRIVQFYALASVIFLYVTLLISPLYSAFSSLPLRIYAITSRRALGISAFYFGLLHSLFAFFGLLNGFDGWSFLGNKYKFPVLLGLFVMLILAILASTSFSWVIRKLGRKWKYLHRLIYLASIILIFHILILGTHFHDILQNIPQTFADAVIVLLLLEGGRLDKHLSKKYGKDSDIRTLSFIFFILLSLVMFVLFPMGGLNNLGYQVHN